MNTTPKTMRALAVAFSLITIASSVKAQISISCDSIVIGQIHYSATNAQVIEVPATVTNGACVGYPSFNLYNQNGDTLAKETVDFFCLSFGSPGIHVLEVFPGANLVPGMQNLTLELFAGFGDTLLCTWNLNIDLCPPDSCVQAHLYLTDGHSQLGQGPVVWFLEDSTGLTVGSGQFNMDGTNSTAIDSICLPPGSNYRLWVSPFAAINVFDSITLGVSSNYQLSTGTNTYVQNDSTLDDLFFDWYEECEDFTNAVREVEPPSFTVFQSGEILVIELRDGIDAGQLELMNVHGQLLLSSMATGRHNEINIQGFSSGAYVLRSTSRSGLETSKLISIQ